MSEKKKPKKKVAKKKVAKKKVAKKKVAKKRVGTKRKVKATGKNTNFKKSTNKEAHIHGIAKSIEDRTYKGDNYTATVTVGRTNHDIWAKWRPDAMVDEGPEDPVMPVSSRETIPLYKKFLAVWIGKHPSREIKNKQLRDQGYLFPDLRYRYILWFNRKDKKKRKMIMSWFFGARLPGFMRKRKTINKVVKESRVKARFKVGYIEYEADRIVTTITDKKKIWW